MFGFAAAGVPSFGDKAWKSPANLVTVGLLPAHTYVQAAGTLTATANGALSINGFASAVGQRVLVVGQTIGSHNGIYNVTDAGSAGTPWVLTRASDANTAALLPQGTIIYVRGDAFSDFDLVWMQTVAIVTMASNQAWVLVRGPAQSWFASAVQAVPNNGGLLSFDSRQYGGTDWATLPATSFVIPAGQGGIWHFDAATDFAANVTGQRGIRLLLNGNITWYTQLPANAAGGTAVAVSGDVLAQAGNTITVFAYQTSGGALNAGVSAFATLSAHWVKG